MEANLTLWNTGELALETMLAHAENLASMSQAHAENRVWRSQVCEATLVLTTQDHGANLVCEASLACEESQAALWASLVCGAKPNSPRKMS